jgi:hypothetical protein
MQIQYPSKNQIMKFFLDRSGFMSVVRICELLVAHDHNNVQPEEIQHIKGFLHQLKSQDFLLIKNEGEDIYNESFSSTPDRIEKYFAKDKVQDYSDLTKRTKEELEEIIRRNENPHIAASLHSRALLELKLRRDKKIDDYLDSDVKNVNRAKTTKTTLKTKDVFIETRRQGGDEHILFGKRDGNPEKAHIIIDEENGSIRQEDGRQEPTDIAPLIETVITFPDGKKIKSSRGVLTEVPVSYLKVEIEKVDYSVNAILKEGVADTFMVTIHILLKNFSKEKVLVKNIRTELQVPEGYSAPNRFGYSFKSEFSIDPQDILSGTIQFSTSINGRSIRVAPGAEWEENKIKIMSGISSAKIVFKFVAGCFYLSGRNTIEETFDLTNDLVPKLYKATK